MDASNPQAPSAEKASLDRLFELLNAPPSIRTGAADAVENLRHSLEAVSNYLPLGLDISSLDRALEYYSNYPFDEDIPQRDRNVMAGRYGAFPVYSLFTQKSGDDEPPEHLNAFYFLSGLLLAEIWKSQAIWDPIPEGYGHYVSQLRKLRTSNSLDLLPPLKLNAESVRAFLNDAKGEFLGTAQKLANQLKLTVLTTDNKVESRALKKDLVSENVPDHPKPSRQPTNVQPRAVSVPPTSENMGDDLGDKDEWTVHGRIVRRSGVTKRPTPIRPETIILQRTAPEQPGKDNAESGVETSIVVAPSAQNGERLPDLALQQSLVLEACFANEFDNQYLKYTWENLNDTEVATVVTAIKATLSKKTAPLRKKLGALISGLSIITGRSPKDLAEIHLEFSGPAVPTSMATIFLSQACWFSPFPPLRRFIPTPEQSEWLIPVGEGCFLPLTAELHSALLELAQISETLGNALPIHAGTGIPEAFKQLASDFCSSVRKDARTRVNVSWLRAVMFNRLYALTRDEVGSSATLGKTELSNSPGLFYATFEPNTWRNHYRKSLSTILFTPTDVGAITNEPYGSRQYPDPEKLRQKVQSLAKGAMELCSSAKSLSEILEAHNALSFYTFLMLIACSGHRPSTAYTFGPMYIDIENRWAIISDKITSPATRVRLIPLPGIVAEQLQRYRVHLLRLSARICALNPSLAARISCLADEPGSSLMPFFFKLGEDLLFHEIKLDDTEAWPYETNAFRHFLATKLAETGIPREYIAILMGHIGVGQYGFGKYSALSPKQWKSLIAPALDAALEWMGFEVVSGIPHNRRPTPNLDSEIKKLLKTDLIDLFAKAGNHSKQSHNDKKILRAAFKSARERMPSDSSRDQVFDAVREEIITRSTDAPDRLAPRFNLLTRYMRIYRHALKTTTIPGWAGDLNPQEAAFGPKSLAHARQAAKWREKLLLTATNFDTTVFHELLGMAVVSSILFGCFLRIDLLDQLPQKLLGGVRRYKEWIWIDFDDPKCGGVFRWFPDKVTTLLIGRLLKSFPETTANEGLTRRGLIKTGEMLGGDVQTKESERIVRILAERANAYFSLRLPGALMAYSRGDLRAASLSEGALLRLLSGQPLAPPPPTEPLERKNIRPHSNTSGEVAEGLSAVQKLFDAVRDVFPASAAGAKNLQGTRKNPLTKLTGNLTGIATNNMPTVVYALFQWADHLAREGSVIVRNPSPLTIYGYLTDIARPLTRHASEVDFLGLSEAELSDIYTRVVEFGKKSTRSSRAQSLRFFHDFCVEEFDLDDVDWEEVAPGSTRGYDRVSANILTHAEYLNARSLIAQHTGLQKRDRHMLEVALILIYRCGLRLGELLRLTLSDISLDRPYMLLVRNGLYGRTKTHAGIRQVPWIDRIDEGEQSLLIEWLKHRETIAKGDPWCALFGTDTEARMLEMRLYVARNLLAIIKHVSGDPNVRIHHIRHAVGTSGLALGLSDGSQNPIVSNAALLFNFKSDNPEAEFRTFHLDDNLPSRRILYGVGQALGHASLSTTCGAYGHGFDFSFHDFVDSEIELRKSDLARLVGMKPVHLNVLCQDKPEISPQQVAMEWLYKSIEGMTPETALAATQVSSSTLPLPAPLRPISSLHLVHWILLDFANGFPLEQVAQRHARDKSEIEALAEACKSLERKTGYLAYGLDSISSGREKQANLPTDRIFSGAAKDLSKLFGELIVDPKLHQLTQDGIEIWRNHYQRGYRGLRIPYENEGSRFVRFLKELGYSPEQIMLSSSEWDEASILAAKNGYGVPATNMQKRSISYRSHKSGSAGRMHAPSLFVARPLHQADRSTKKAGVGMQMRRLHALFFLAAVASDYQRFLTNPAQRFINSSAL